MESKDRCNHTNEYKWSTTVSRYYYSLSFIAIQSILCEPFNYNKIEQENDCLHFQWDLETELKGRIKGQRLTDREKNEIWKSFL